MSAEEVGRRLLGEVEAVGMDEVGLIILQPTTLTILHSFCDRSGIYMVTFNIRFQYRLWTVSFARHQDLLSKRHLALLQW